MVLFSAQRANLEEQTMNNQAQLSPGSWVTIVVSFVSLLVAVACGLYHGFRSRTYQRIGRSCAQSVCAGGIRRLGAKAT